MPPKIYQKQGISQWFKIALSTEFAKKASTESFQRNWCSRRICSIIYNYYSILNSFIAPNRKAYSVKYLYIYSAVQKKKKNPDVRTHFSDRKLIVFSKANSPKRPHSRLRFERFFSFFFFLRKPTRCVAPRAERKSPHRTRAKRELSFSLSLSHPLYIYLHGREKLASRRRRRRRTVEAL